jgi:hypothetical protein
LDTCGRPRRRETVSKAQQDIYGRLFASVGRPEARDGEWALLDPLPAWDGNPTADKFIAGTWRGDTGRLVVAVNYGDTRAQCYIRISGLEGPCLLRDLVNPGIEFGRDAGELATRGLYLDVGPWGHHVFEVVST